MSSATGGQREAEGGSSSDDDPPTVIEAPPPPASQRPSFLKYNKTRVVEGRSYIDTSETSSTSSHDKMDTAGTSEAQGEEQMVSFVAADLQERIRMSSPPHSAGTVTTSSSSSPSPYPPLIPDAQVLIDIESNAQQVAGQLDRVIQEFNGSLHGMTDLTVECMDLYGDNVAKTCDSVDASIKSMYQMLAKAEELTKVLKPVPRLAQQVREIKRILDLFESHMQKSTGF